MNLNHVCHARRKLFDCLKNSFQAFGEKQGEYPHQNLYEFLQKTAKNPPAWTSRFRISLPRAVPPITRSFKVAYGHCLFARNRLMPAVIFQSSRQHGNLPGTEAVSSPDAEQRTSFSAEIIMMHFPSNNAQVQSNTFI